MKKEEISLKNTKAEILEALNEALLREKNLSKMKSNPEKEERDKKVNKAIASAKENVEKNIFSLELINQFKELELAIQEEEKLKELYGVEKELNQLTTVMNAGKDLLASIEEKKKTETEKLENAIKNLEEEYNYKTKRERELCNNQWQDEKKTREANLKAMELEAKSLLEEAKKQQDHLNELEQKVNDFPILLEKEYTKGKEEAATLLTKDHQYAVELLKKDFQNIVDRQEDKIASLSEELLKTTQLNESLQVKIDKAYVEMKELATKTVEANGGVKILGNASGEGK